MGIIKAPTSTKPQLPPKPTLTVAKPDYKSIAVDMRIDPKETILAHVEGSSWTVDYYSQVVARDSGLAGQGLGTDPGPFDFYW